MRYIQIFDQFSIKPKLRIEGKPRLTNFYVSLFSIFVVIGFLTITIILSFNILRKNEFQIIENTNSKTFNNFKLDTKNPISALVTRSLGQEFEDPDRIYNMKLRYFSFYPNTLNQTENLKMTEIKKSNCSFKELEGDGTSEYANIYNIYKTINCWDLSPYNITIFGEDSAETAQGVLVLYLNQCVNTTASSNCLPQEELDKKLREIKLPFIYSNRDIDNNLKNPFVEYTDGQVFRFSNSLKTRYIYGIDSVEYFSDEGLFFEEIISHKSYRIEKYNTFQNLRLGSVYDPGTFGNINFFGSGKKKIYQRRYQKFHAIFPYLVTLYHIILILFKILAKLFGGGIFEEFFFFKLVEKENFESFQKINTTQNYDDLFKKIQISKDKIDYDEENAVNIIREQNNLSAEGKNEWDASDPSSFNINQGKKKNNFFTEEERKKLSSRAKESNQINSDQDGVQNNAFKKSYLGLKKVNSEKKELEKEKEK